MASLRARLAALGTLFFGFGFGLAFALTFLLGFGPGFFAARFGAAFFAAGFFVVVRLAAVLPVCAFGRPAGRPAVA